VQHGNRILLAACLDFKLVGTMQILTATPPDEPHGADIAKLLVLRSARGHGIGSLLMKNVEEASRLPGKTLLVLDTATGDLADKLYVRLGWTRVGIILTMPSILTEHGATRRFFWKQLA
jgi:GNAT superfamily N-acetyltransferase